LLVADRQAPSAFHCPASGANGSRSKAQMPKRLKSEPLSHLVFCWSPMGKRPPHFIKPLSQIFLFCIADFACSCVGPLQPALY
jgi:hypothetical protein